MPLLGEVFTDWWQIALHQLELGDLPWVDDERMPRPLPPAEPGVRYWREGDTLYCEVDWEEWGRHHG